VLTVVTVVAMVGLATWKILSPKEPVFQGKRLSIWLAGYKISKYPVSSPQQKKADEAMRHVGTNAIPTLFRILQAHDSPITLKLISVAQRQRLMKVDYTPPSARKYSAGVAFRMLGPSASNAVPELIRIYQKDSALETRNAIIIALGHIGPPAKDAAPLLLEATTSINFPVRANAANTLKAIDREAAAKAGVK